MHERPSTAVLAVLLAAACGSSPMTTPTPTPAPHESPPPQGGAAEPASTECPKGTGGDALGKEVERLLEIAAEHASVSGACYDSSGLRVSVGDIRVCIGEHHDDRLEVIATYAVTRTKEGDTRLCGRTPEGCPWAEPVTASHSTTLRLLPSQLGWLMVVPLQVPGILGKGIGTPLPEPHDGDCYKGEPFVPAPIVLAEAE